MANQVLVLQACSEDGFTDPFFQADQPPGLLKAGMKPNVWQQFISEANQAVKYRWFPDCLFWSLLCWIPFFCNQHNKNIQYPMARFCAKWNNGLMPIGFKVEYEMKTFKKMVRAPGGHGQGAQLETVHCIAVIGPVY